ncbi:hypothetical protein [Clostridium estertheticum]|uniref:hypothetical protein n=1 Tax=Clostridium estertheticum TaxID=238834 RepID=UPI001C0BE48A|nr:hypothetical protein [Clostridium estertheticum]MBU3075699.1 hypothetical protein [Clostridium estertheticum]MBU3165811.1 hypothetical protein [Clostridium estertheticum]
MGKITIKGNYSELMKKALNNTEVKKCIVCDGIEGTIIDSHTVPQFILRNISLTHEYKSSYQFELPDVENEKLGIKKSGIFRLICGTCDTELFKTYETEKNYSIPCKEQRILAEIALKNALKKQYDLLLTLNLLEPGIEKHKEVKKVFDYYVSILYANDNEIQRIWDILESGLEDYKIIYKKYLNYKTPVAAQGHFPYARGFEETYKPNECVIPWMNIAVLPFSNKTLVVLFTRNDNTIYEGWIKKFGEISENEKLDVINDMIFTELEDYFIDKDLMADDLLSLRLNDKTSMKEFFNRQIQINNYLEETYKIQ